MDYFGEFLLVLPSGNNNMEDNMKADKVAVKITVEALSIDCLWSLLAQAAEQVKCGNENGNLRADDGDTITWKTERTAVEF